jgi:glucose dehydrogenase
MKRGVLVSANPATPPKGKPSGKMGLIYVFNRKTGDSLIPYVERPEIPLGSIEKLAPVPIPWEATGKSVWKASLPAAGTATPVTYEVNGEQYVVIPAGGHSMCGTAKGDSVVAYKLSH